MKKYNLLVIKLFIQLPCLTLRPSISGIRNSVLHLKADFIPHEFSCFVSVLLDKLLDSSLLFCMGVKFCIYVSWDGNVSVKLRSLTSPLSNPQTADGWMTTVRKNSGYSQENLSSCYSFHTHTHTHTHKDHLNCPSFSDEKVTTNITSYEAVHGVSGPNFGKLENVQVGRYPFAGILISEAPSFQN
jgi:hypothetical protein